MAYAAARGATRGRSTKTPCDRLSKHGRMSLLWRRSEWEDAAEELLPSSMEALARCHQLGRECINPV